MTTQEIIDYYANLLIQQYLGKPKAYATVQTQVTPVVMDQLPAQVQDAYNVIGTDIAVGVQLDVIGKYVGVSRNGYGFNGQPISLDDADFWSLIRFATILNSAGSSLAEIQTLLETTFANQVFVFDYANFHMNYFIDSSIGTQDLVQMLVLQGLLPKPMGVQLAITIYSPSLKFFGMPSASTVKAYAAQHSVTINQAVIALTTNVWQFNSVDTPVVGQWLSVQQGVY